MQPQYIQTPLLPHVITIPRATKTALGCETTSSGWIPVPAQTSSQCHEPDVSYAENVTQQLGFWTLILDAQMIQHRAIL